MSKGKWDAVEVGEYEMFLGQREGESGGDGYSPFYDMGDVPRDLAERIAACLNACRCIPTSVLGDVIDRLFTAMMSIHGDQAYRDGPCGDLEATGQILEIAGVDLTQLLRQCELRNVQQRPTEPAEKA